MTRGRPNDRHPLRADAPTPESAVRRPQSSSAPMSSTGTTVTNTFSGRCSRSHAPTPARGRTQAPASAAGRPGLAVPAVAPGARHAACHQADRVRHRRRDGRISQRHQRGERDEGAGADDRVDRARADARQRDQDHVEDGHYPNVIGSPVARRNRSVTALLGIDPALTAQ